MAKMKLNNSCPLLVLVFVWLSGYKLVYIYLLGLHKVVIILLYTIYHYLSLKIIHEHFTILYIKFLKEKKCGRENDPQDAVIAGRLKIEDI